MIQHTAIYIKYVFLSQPHASNKITIFNLKYKRFFNMSIEDLSKEILFLIYFLYIHTYNHFTTTFIKLIKILNTKLGYMMAFQCILKNFHLRYYHNFLLHVMIFNYNHVI